jgi:hypothetical protein
VDIKFPNDFIAFVPVHSELTNRSNFEVLHLSNYALTWWHNEAATGADIFGTPTVKLLSVLSSHLFGCHQYPEIFVLLRQTSFLETATSHSEPNQGNRVGIPFQWSIFEPETAWQRTPCELEHCHGGESSHWANVQAFIYVQLHVTASAFPHNKLGWVFGYCGMNSKWTIPLISKEVISIVFIYDFDMQALFEPYTSLKKTLDFLRASPPQASESIEQVSLAFIPNFTQNLMLICCSKNRSFIFATRCRYTRLNETTTSAQLAFMRWNRTWCKLKHAQTCLYYDKVAF